MRILGEGDEELVLPGGELHVLARHSDNARGEFDLEVADGQPRVPRPGGAPQDGAHAGDELVVDERLAVQVIVAAARSALFGPIPVAQGASTRARSAGGSKLESRFAGQV